MEFWIIKDGEKEGPLLDFDLRSRIRAGEVTAEQKVWCSALDEWTPLGEVGLFTNEFEITKVTEENVDDYLSQVDREIEEPVVQSGLPSEIHLWRRFAARWFDYLVFLALLFSVIAITGIDLAGLQRNLFFPFVMILPWLFVETTLLHFWGTTPGKWLTGLQVRDAEGRKLSAGASFTRTMRVMILGMGFAQPLFREVCHLISLWLAVKKKIVMWDTGVGIRLERIRETPVKWVTFALGLLFSFIVLTVAAYQIGLSQMTPEELNELEQRVQRILAPAKAKNSGS